MLVAGGVYVEACWAPPSQALLGSGGRAALAMCGRGPVALETFHPPARADDVVANFAPFGIDVRVHPSSDVVEFTYPHPLSSPRIAPIPLPTAGRVAVAGASILRFGCLEGSFVVEADVAVYDPQCEAAPEPFGSNGSRAARLAIVLNAREARASSGVDDVDEAAQAIARRDGACVVVVKDGTRGARVHEKGGRVGLVPAFAARRPWNIGSGDVFTAMFAHHWATASMPAIEAAEAASKHAAHHVATRSLPCPMDLPAMVPVAARDAARVLVVGDVATTAGRFLLEESIDGLVRLGARPRRVAASLYHTHDETGDEDAGSTVLLLPGGPSGRAPAIAAGAIAAGRTVVAFVEDDEGAAALRQAGCIAEGDLSSALLIAASVERR